MSCRQICKMLIFYPHPAVKWAVLSLDSSHVKYCSGKLNSVSFSVPLKVAKLAQRGASLSKVLSLGLFIVLKNNFSHMLLIFGLLIFKYEEEKKRSLFRQLLVWRDFYSHLKLVPVSFLVFPPPFLPPPPLPLPGALCAAVGFPRPPPVVINMPPASFPPASLLSACTSLTNSVSDNRSFSAFSVNSWLWVKLCLLFLFSLRF